MSRFMTGLLTAAVTATTLPAPAIGQLGSYNPLPGPQGTVVIRNARIVSVSAPVIENGSVVISGGKITAVGTSVSVPAGAQVIDGTGLHVYPGMMDAGTSMGLSEIPQGAASTVDNSETGRFNPNVQALNGFNPHSAHIGVTRVVGITQVVSRPSGGLVSGQAGVFQLAGSTAPAMALVPRAALVIQLPSASFGGGFGGGRGGGAGNTQEVNRTRELQLDSIRTLFADATAYGKAHAAWGRDRTLPRPAHDVVLESLQAVISGEMPVIFTADRAADIRAAITFAEDLKVRPIILGGREAVSVAVLLKEKNVPVVLTGVMDLPSREDDPYDINFAAPARLAAAGVKFAITSGDAGAEVRNLPYHAGMAAAFGLSKDDALRSVTLWPAEIFGIADRVGSIEVGKMANLVVTTGDMLEATTDTRYLFIDGRSVPLATKHTQLYEMFKDRQ
ncbi:MAG: amidohydrolase family protein [Gemmatimonadales bacterium]